MLDERRWNLLACPVDRSALQRKDAAAVCSACSTEYPVDGHQVDLGLREPLEIDVPTVVAPYGRSDPRYERLPRAIPRNPEGVVDVDPHAYAGNLWYGNGLTRELASWMPAGTSEDTALDLGCGERRFEAVLEKTGMTYVGFDVAGAAPDILGVGEALPFADGSIDFVFSLAVLPHARRPALVCREVRRVLKPGGLFIGTAQFLEPCHMQSRHHASLLGLLDWLEEGELEVLEIEANDRWSGPQACAEMGYLPNRYRIARSAGRLATGAHRLYRRAWPARPAPLGEGLPERFTGGFRFITRAPG